MKGPGGAVMPTGAVIDQAPWATGNAHATGSASAAPHVRYLQSSSRGQGKNSGTGVWLMLSPSDRLWLTAALPPRRVAPLARTPSLAMSITSFRPSIASCSVSTTRELLASKTLATNPSPTGRTTAWMGGQRRKAPRKTIDGNDDSPLNPLDLCPQVSDLLWSSGMLSDMASPLQGKASVADGRRPHQPILA